MATTFATSIRSASVLASILLLAAGCTARTYPIKDYSFLRPASVSMSPRGTGASIEVRVGAESRTVTGELIEVRGDGLLVLTLERSELTLLPYGRMVEMDFEDEVGINTSVHGSLYYFIERIPPLVEDQVRQRVLARFSRYPFGIDQERLERLLEALGQSELIVIGS